MSDASTTTTERSCILESLVQKAAGIVAGSQKAVGIARAMELVGFSEEERKTMKYYQKVRRKAARLSVVEIGKKSSTPVASSIGAEPSVSTVSTLTVSTERNNSENCEPDDDAESDDEEDSVRRRLVLAAGNGEESIVVQTKEKKSRRSPKEAQKVNAKKCSQI